MIKCLQPVARASAEGLVSQVYTEIKLEFGTLAEPFTLHSSSPALLAGAWSACRESLLVGRVQRDIKEAVAATVSRINRCPYCVDAHTIMLSATGEHGNAAAISHHRDGQIQDPATRSIIYWAAATRSPGADILQAPPFSNREAPEIIGTAVFFHYVNRMASVLLSEAPLPSNQRWLRRPLKRMAAWYFSRAVQRSKLPGASLGLLPEAELPADLAWAEMAPNIAGAFARFAAVVDKAGVDLLSEEVRACVSEQVQTWSGEDPGLSQNWVEQAITGFDEASRAMARLLLLAALAPYQIDEGTSILS